MDGGDLDRAGVLVVSDAGAARGQFDRERVQLTEAFVDKVRRQSRRVVWLNPMPRSRWSGTTAEVVAQFLPMFELSERGLYDAIRVPRGLSARAR